MTAADAESGDQPALPPRQETFLARYSRNFKMAVVVAALAVTVLPWALGRIMSDHAVAVEKKRIQHPMQIQGADRQMPGTKRGASDNHGGPSTNEAALNDPDDRSIKLTPAPDPALNEDTPQGSLPRISEDGRQPWQVYARPFNAADKRSRIAIVITDLGLARGITDAAIAQLPAAVTLVFTTEGSVTGAWCGRARQDGHEVLISLPMEPFDYPRSDPGPNTLLTSLPNSDNIQRFITGLRQSTGYVGITTLSGSRFTTDPQKMQPVIDIVKNRGLMLFDAGVAPHSVMMDLAKYNHIPAVAATQRLDDNLSPEAIDRALQQLEKTAQVDGRAVGMAAASPIVIEHIKTWVKELPGRGIALAPVSAVVR